MTNKTGQSVEEGKTANNIREKTRPTIHPAHDEWHFHNTHCLVVQGTSPPYVTSLPLTLSQVPSAPSPLLSAFPACWSRTAVTHCRALSCRCLLTRTRRTKGRQAGRLTHPTHSRGRGVRGRHVHPRGQRRCLCSRLVRRGREVH